MRTRKLVAWVIAVAACAACSGGPDGPTGAAGANADMAGRDGGEAGVAGAVMPTADGGHAGHAGHAAHDAHDAAVSIDAATSLDASTDAGTHAPDAEARDAAVPDDAAPRDAAISDASPDEPTPHDAALPHDADVPTDSGLSDAAVPDDAAVPAPSDAGSHDAAVGDASSPTDPPPHDAGTPEEPDPTFEPTYLSDTDRSPNGVVLASDRLSAEWLGLGTYGVRSTRSLSAHQGVFYFEAYAPILDFFQIGVATALVPLDKGAGQTTKGFGVEVSGIIFHADQPTNITPSPSGAYGFVVDYRGDNPVVHLIAGTAESAHLVASQTLSDISEPLFIHLCGMRRIEGFQATINPGNDTVNRPFTFDPKAILTAHNLEETAQALVLGWGQTHRGVWNEPPQLAWGANSLEPRNVGQAFTLTAAATDHEDGALDAQIAWDVVSTGAGPEHVHGTGPSFTFTPSVLGKHPIIVSVTDSGGKRVEKRVTLEALGTLPQHTSVQLTPEPGLSGAGIAVSSDGLRAHWTQNSKLGVRANQGLYHDFWYVEGHRLIPEDNQAIGLVIGGVSLNPYQFDVTPPSCSVNTVGPGIYRNLISIKQLSLANTEYYGLAVDYRGDYPIVYVIVRDVLVATLELKDVTVPLYPMLYGNSNARGAAWDMEINFGGSVFHEHPVQVLQAAGVNPDGLKLCWGNQNAACSQH